MTVAELQSAMQKALEALKGELAGIRTGRANPAVLENIKVGVYSTQMTLVQLATIAVVDPQLLQIVPFDVANVEPIAKAIQEANLGMNPVVDGNLIKVPIPALTEERRQQYVKLAKQILEQGRIRLRQTRQQAMEDLNRLLKEKTISEDYKFAQEKEVQKVTDDFMDRVEQLGKAKEQELIQI